MSDLCDPRLHASNANLFKQSMQQKLNFEIMNDWNKASVESTIFFQLQPDFQVLKQHSLLFLDSKKWANSAKQGRFNQNKKTLTEVERKSDFDQKIHIRWDYDWPKSFSTKDSSRKFWTPCRLIKWRRLGLNINSYSCQLSSRHSQVRVSGI